MSIRRVEDSASFHGTVDWIMAALFLFAAVAAGIYFGFPLVFDPQAADFNGFAFVSVILFGIALRYAIPAIRSEMRSRRFGPSVMEMEGETVAPGETLRGVVRVPANLAPLGDYKLRLQCVEQVMSGGSTSDPTARDVIRSEETLRVSPKAVNAGEGVPFAFMIPRDARTTTVLASDFLPSGDRGEGIRWILEVTAPVRGVDYYAIFGVVVRARSNA